MSNTPKISVIIPSYNRFNYLLEALESVKIQNYSNLEVFVINDGSTQEDYYRHNFDSDIQIIHLKENQKTLHGFGPGAIRNFGTNKASGDFLAFLDDDDIWLKGKLKFQVNQMISNNMLLSSTEGLYGEGRFNSNSTYLLYNKEKYMEDYKYLYKDTDFINKNQLPKVWTSEFTNIWNCFITSSVIVERKLFQNLGSFRNLPKWADYDCWKGLQQLTDSIYVDEPFFYFDGLHGDGRNYEK
jgi:glycosyltransferase involved in cell wall biosynthesis